MSNIENIDIFFAAINDEKDLKDKEVVDFLLKLENSKNISEASQEDLESYLKAIKRGNSKNGKIAAKILRVLEEKDAKFYKEYLGDLEDQDIEFIHIFSEKYPKSLYEIERPPFGIYVNGEFNPEAPKVAVVGTRDATSQRLKDMPDIVAKLVDMGFEVVSGLANGVDERAHQSTIDQEGVTYAVLPGDVNNIYPESNYRIARKMREKGAVLSEVSEKIDIHRGRFVDRNRITSGLCQAVIVGASKDSGGTVHQSRFTKNQGRKLLLYDPDYDDGQSPEKIKDMGAETFSDPSELDKLLDSEVDYDEPDVKDYNLDFFIN